MSDQEAPARDGLYRVFLHGEDPATTQLPLGKPGSWTPLDQFLQKHRPRLKGALKDTAVMHSVPSVFARPIQFYQALANPHHSLHVAVQGEWRGLLALFALGSRWGISLDTSEFRVLEHATNAYEKNLHSILHNQLPMTKAAGQQAKLDTQWVHWWLLRSEGQLLGATSPWSMVYTAAEYKCPESVLWQDENGLLKDPISYLTQMKNNRAELALLLHWVETVHKGMPWDMDLRLKPSTAVLSVELKQWQDDLKAALGAGHTLRPEVKTLFRGLDFEAAQIKEFAPYNKFLVPLKESSGGESDSDLLLQSTRSPDAQVIVLSRGRNKLDGRKVWRHIFADQIDVESLDRNRIDVDPSGKRVQTATWRSKTGQTIDWPYLIAEDVFLPSKLARLRLTAQGYQPTADYVLPLTPAFFEYFNCRDIVRSSEDEPDDGQESPDTGKVSLRLIPSPQGVTVRLTLPLSGGSLDVERIYREDRDLITVAPHQPFCMNVWPDFSAPDWSDYACLVYAPRGSAIVAAPLLGGGHTLERCRDDGSQKEIRIWSHDQVPIGFALFTPEKELSAGIVLRKEIASPPEIDVGRAWSVGVDFGTSNTLVVYREGEGSIDPLIMEGRTLTLAMTSDKLVSEIDTSFFPTSQVTPPFATLVSQRDFTFLGPVRPTHTPVFRAREGEVALMIASDQMVENVKWGAGGAHFEDKPLTAYLSALQRYILCEARREGIGQVKIEWSYPLSQSKGARSSMKGQWAKATGQVSVVRKEDGALPYSSGNRLTVTAGLGICESEAICRYLKALNPALLPVAGDTLSVAMDIGGGSADMGFWSGGRLLDGVSLKLAGNDLVRPICGLPDFPRRLVKVLHRTDEKLSGDIEKSFGKSPVLTSNMLLTRALRGDDGDSGKGEIDRVARVLWSAEEHKGEPPWMLARSLIYVYFSGIGFYTGLHARRHLGGNRKLGLYIGGLGSMLLTWLGTRDEVERVMTSAINEGMKLDTGDSGFTIDLFGTAFGNANPEHLKQEVARGLLAPALDAQLAGTLDAGGTLRTIVGETGWRNANGALAWDLPVDAFAIRELQPPPNLDSTYIAQFMTNVLPLYVDELSLDKRLHDFSRSKVDGAKVQHYLRCMTAPVAGSGGAASTRSAQEVEGELQPVFGYELKVVLENYASLWPKK